MGAAALALAVGCGLAAGQGPGDGISKSTYASSEPLKGERFLVDFFPASKETNECPGNVCNCSWRGEAFEVYEGRTALDASGFGLHLVDTEKSTAGGLPVKNVEDHFAEKLAGAKGYDAFYDYATGLCLESASFDLVLHKLERAAHDYLPYAFDDSAGRTWYGALVRVPASQMVIDMLTDTSPKLHAVAANLTVLENRLPPRQAVRCKEAFQKNASHTVAYVSRAASDLDAVHAWYDAMNATLSYHSHHTAPEVVTKCFRWYGAEADVCFRRRPGGTRTCSTRLHMRAVLLSGKNSPRANDPSKNQPKRRRFVRDGEA
jgi:hypothetical protein